MPPTTQATAATGFPKCPPINTARRVAEDLITTGHVQMAVLGIQGRALWPELANALNLSTNQGVLIEQVASNGPAAQAGIRGGSRTILAGLQELRIGGDVLTAIDGTPVTNNSDLTILLNRHRPGDTVTATIIRDGKKMNIKVKLGSAQ